MPPNTVMLLHRPSDETHVYIQSPGINRCTSSIDIILSSLTDSLQPILIHLCNSHPTLDLSILTKEQLTTLLQIEGIAEKDHDDILGHIYILLL